MPARSNGSRLRLVSIPSLSFYFFYYYFFLEMYERYLGLVRISEKDFLVQTGLGIGSRREWGVVVENSPCSVVNCPDYIPSSAFLETNLFSFFVPVSLCFREHISSRNPCTAVQGFPFCNDSPFSLHLVIDYQSSGFGFLSSIAATANGFSQSGTMINHCAPKRAAQQGC